MNTRMTSRSFSGQKFASRGLAPCSHLYRSTKLRCRASDEPDYRVRKTLPIFPLSVVAFPAATVPLMIFEARYRVLFNTLLSGMEGIEEGLVQTESPWCGSKRFGMCYVDNEGRMASIGSTLEISEFANVPDGRLFVTSKGKERFKVLKVVAEKPILLCEVEVLKEDEETEEAKQLSLEVADLLRNTIRLNVKMQNIETKEDQIEPEELSTLGPRDLSFWVASFFSDVKLLQQNLLEEEDTVRRLQKEKDVLTETVRYYSAASALKSAFSAESSETAAGEVEVSENKVQESTSESSSAEKGDKTDPAK
jgi:Lon protease-like protein